MPSITSLTLRTIALSAALVVSACGGGGDSSGDTGNCTSGINYGGCLVPGSVTMTITHRVKITTTLGVINIGLDAAHAPVSSANFLKYVSSGTYLNTIFHRVIPGFVIQGGGYTDPGGTATAVATDAAIGLESRNGLSNTIGTLAVARTSDPNTGTSQFYINLVNNLNLNYFGAQQGGEGYAVFGTVMDQASMDVVNAVSRVATATRTVGGEAMSNWPVTDVTVTAVDLQP